MLSVERFSTPEVQPSDSLPVYTAMLGQACIQARAEIIAQIHRVTPVGIQKTAEPESVPCGPYKLEWKLGEQLVAAYVNTSDPFAKKHVMDCMETVSQIVDPSPARWFPGINERIRQVKMKSNLSLAGRVASTEINCVSVSTEGSENVLTLHGLTCESADSQHMQAIFNGSDEELQEVQSRLHAFGHVPEDQIPHALRELYIPSTQ